MSLSLLKQRFRDFIDNPSGKDIYRIVVGFETFVGLRPFVMVDPPGGQPPRMQLSRFGSFMTFFYLTTFLACCVGSIYYEAPVVVVSEDILNLYEARAIVWLQGLNLLVIFCQVYQIHS